MLNQVNQSAIGRNPKQTVDKQMKKMLFVAAAILGIASCATSEVDGCRPSSSDKMKTVTVDVSTSQTSDQATRVAIVEDAVSGDLLLSWADDDALGAWSSSASSFERFDIDEASISESRESATFNGSINEADSYYRLMHPYIEGAMFSRKTYTIDFAAQSTDMAQDEYYTLGQSLYMISSDISLEGTEAPVMKHIGAVLDINLRFDNLPEDDSVQLESLTIEGNGALEIPQSATIDFNLDVEDDSFVATSTTGAIEVEAINSPVLSSTETYALKASTMPFTFGAGEELTMTVVLVSSAKKYTKSFTLANSGSDDIEVERAMSLTLNKECDMGDVEGLWNGSIADNYSGGDGSAENPYLISSGAELAKLAHEVNDNSDNQQEDVLFKLTCDINLGGLPWTSIGKEDYGYYFNGIFDGAGYTISGLYIGVGSAAMQGIFGYIGSNALIANLTVEGEVNSSAPSSNCGGIAGMNQGTIVNCHNKATITGISRVGGIAGGSGNGQIINCSNIGKVTGSDYTVNDDEADVDVEVSPHQRIGGIAGTSAGAKIINCYNAGVVENTLGNAFAVVSPGGDAENLPTVSYCYYSDECGGIDSYGTATAKSLTEITSSTFISTLNDSAAISAATTCLNKYSSAEDFGISVATWSIGADSYPTTK